MARVKVQIIFDDTDNTIFEYDRVNGLKSFSIVSEGKADEGIDYSMKANSGELSAIDISPSTNSKYTSLYDFLLKKIEYNEIKINIILDNKNIAHFVNNGRIDYNTNTKSFSVNYQSNLVKLQNGKFKLQLDKDNINVGYSANDLYTILKSKSEPIIGQEFYIDNFTSNYLKNIIIKYPYLEESTLWEQWNKLCILAQLSIYPKDNKIYVKRWI